MQVVMLVTSVKQADTTHVFKHLQSSESCRISCSADCFTVLDSATTKFQVKLSTLLLLSRPFGSIIELFLSRGQEFFFLRKKHKSSDWWSAGSTSVRKLLNESLPRLVPYVRVLAETRA